MNLNGGLSTLPVVAILDARQVGNTTLARQLEKDSSGSWHHFDQEDPNNRTRLADASFVLRELKGLRVRLGLWLKA